MGTDTGPAHLPTGRRRRTLVALPASAESVPQRPQEPPQHQPQYQSQHQAPPQASHQPQHQAAHQSAHQSPRPAAPSYQPPPHQQPSFQHVSQPPHQPYQPYQPYQQPHFPDPPIYGALLRHWADRGRTLPGRHDPEWVRLVAPPVHRGQFSATRDPRGDGR
ncbi:hypothetical protein [Streptomyces sp. NPDC005865]|uniref:hypothetical protein n=1 Tax=Streptomyces sp. NPDC005865 TaxID=3155453 RepID=UPI0033DDA5CA